MLDASEFFKKLRNTASRGDKYRLSPIACIGVIRYIRSLLRLTQRNGGDFDASFRPHLY
jgi:hypothetical protein